MLKLFRNLTFPNTFNRIVYLCLRLASFPGFRKVLNRRDTIRTFQYYPIIVVFEISPFRTNREENKSELNKTVVSLEWYSIDH